MNFCAGIYIYRNGDRLISERWVHVCVYTMWNSLSLARANLQSQWANGKCSFCCCCCPLLYIYIRRRSRSLGDFHHPPNSQYLILCVYIPSRGKATTTTTAVCMLCAKLQRVRSLWSTHFRRGCPYTFAQITSTTSPLCIAFSMSAAHTTMPAHNYLVHLFPLRRSISTTL